MQILNLEQGTDEWLNARLGIPTASRFKDIITPAKGDLSKSYKTYMYELIAEKLGAKNEFFKSDYMERGNELEPQAKAVYELISNNKVQEIGMVKTDDGRIGISPDGLIGEDGGVEIKCPKASTHIRYMINGILPLEYKTQVQGSLWISGRKWWDFMSFHPQLNPFIIKIERDEDYIKKMEEHILFFCDELEKGYKYAKDS